MIGPSKPYVQTDDSGKPQGNNQPKGNNTNVHTCAVPVPPPSQESRSPTIQSSRSGTDL